MCGIVGYFKKVNNGESLNVAAAIESMQHRGPDDRGEWRSAGTGLGFARLSVLDLSDSGHQPMMSPCGRYVLVFNGEIYNFSKIKTELETQGEIFRGHSDSEVLLRLFVLEGFEACLHRIGGMFAFAVWDIQEQTLFLARDRLGIKPLVYAQTEKGYWFASSIPALFELDPRLSRKADIHGIDHFLTYGYIPAPMTGFASIRKLCPAHAMVVQGGEIKSTFRYWDIDHGETSDLSKADACVALREKILEATRIRMVADVPVGAFLSGGVDSSITVAAMMRLSSHPIKTFSIGFDDQHYNELAYAREIAEYLGTDHHEMIVKPDAIESLPTLIEQVGEPLAESSIIPIFHVSQFAREQVTVALTGNGGDESFDGYGRFYRAHRQESLMSYGLIPIYRAIRRTAFFFIREMLPERFGRIYSPSRVDEMLEMPMVEAYKHLLAYCPDEEKSRLLNGDFCQYMGESQTTRYLEEILERAQRMDSYARWPYLDLMSYLPEAVLNIGDVASMSVSLECRSPFLDHEVVEFAYGMLGSSRLTVPGQQKYLLKKAFKDWVPRGFFERPKKGFAIPLDRWLREDFGDYIREYLIEKKILSNWFDQGWIERSIEEHFSGRKQNGQILWSLLVLSIWLDRFDVDMELDSN